MSTVCQHLCTSTSSGVSKGTISDGSWCVVIRSLCCECVSDTVSDSEHGVQVARVSAPARAVIEEAGGKVHLVYYNQLGMRALLRPGWFARKGRLVPRAVQRVPFKKQWRYDRVGAIPAPQAPALVSATG